MELLIYAWLASRSDHLNLQSACELGQGRGQVLEEEALHLWDGPLSPGGVSPTELHRNTPSQCWRIAQWNGNHTHTRSHRNWNWYQHLGWSQPPRCNSACFALLKRQTKGSRSPLFFPCNFKAEHQTQFIRIFITD